MTVESLIPIIGFITLVAGMGWKLNSELSSIKTMLQVFIVKSEGQFSQLEKLEKRIEKLEEKINHP